MMSLVLSVSGWFLNENLLHDVMVEDEAENIATRFYPIASGWP